MGNPFHGLAVLGFYLYFVLNLGQKIMKDRPPMQLKPLLTLFNIFQIGSSVLIFYKVSVCCFTRLCSTERTGSIAPSLSAVPEARLGARRPL